MRSLLLILLLMTVICCDAQVPLTRNVWLNESGTPVKVNTLLADKDQCIWLGAENGLFTYNGREVVLVSDSIREPVTALAVADKSIYLGTDKGLVYEYAQGKKKLLVRAVSPISAIEVTPYGLMIGTLGDGGYYIAGDKSYHFSKKNNLPDDYVYQVAPSATGWLIATDLGVFTVRSGQDHQLLFNRIDFQADIARVVCRKKSKDEYWVGFQEKGIGYITAAGHKDQALFYDKEWKWGQVNDILPEEHAAWIATENGYLLKATINNNIIQLDTVLSLGKKINKVIPDHAGSLWLATADGLTQVTAAYLATAMITENYSLKKVTAITSDSAGSVWYTQDQDLYRYNIRTKRSVPVYHAPAVITCLYQDAGKRLWIGTSNGLFCRGTTGAIKTFATNSELKNDHILSLTGYNGTIWLSGLNGVEALSVNEEGDITDVKHHHKREGIGSDYVYRIFIDSRKRIWFATDGAGISMWDGKQFRQWKQEDGFDSKVVYSITEDPAGRIWTGTLEHGIYVYEHNKWLHYTKLHGLQDETISSLVAGKAGHVLAVNARGIDVWYPGDKEFRHLNRRSRLGVDSSLSDVLNIAAYNDDHAIYFPWQNGLLAFIDSSTTSSIKPSVSITGVYLFLRQLDTLRRYFGYDENYLGFHFRGVNFANPEPLYYRYRLEGLSNEWIPTSDETITFPRLPSGKYTLTVQASLNRAFEHPASTAYPFTIAVPFWLRWWFIALVLLLTGCIVYLVLQRRLGSLKRVALLEKERITFEYDYLKSQVNPHFLFNSLNTLVNLIEEDPESAVTYTGRLSDLYRETLSAHEDDVVTLADEWAVLDKYLYIQQSRFGAALQLISSVPEEVKHRKRIIPLALQLLVENAIKHNVVSTAHPLVIFIDIAADVLIVRNEIRLKMTPEKSSGIGLQNIRKRYALVTSREVTVETLDNEFIVVLPLL